MNEFTQSLRQMDRALFERINGDWTNGFADAFFPLFTDFHHSPVFVVVMSLGILYWIWRDRIFALKWLVAIVLSIALSDLIAYRVFKAHFERPRPPAANIHAVVRGTLHTGNSFPSNHAANTFAVAMTVAGISPLASIPFFVVAILIAYSRVYVGAHFPLDVLGGAALGILCAVFVRWSLRRWLVNRAGTGSSRAQM